MSVENLYTPRGAGHSAPEGDRRPYNQPGNELQEAFMRWLDRVPLDKLGTTLRSSWKRPMKYRETAIEELEGMDLSAVGAVEIAYLMVPLLSEDRYRDRVWSGGFFLTEAFNRCGDDEMVMDLEDARPIHGLGCGLGKGKTLVIEAGLGHFAGENSEGIIINRCVDNAPANALWDIGKGASGPVINYESVQDMGEGSSGPLINYGLVSGRMGSEASGPAVNYGNVSLLCDYFSGQGFNFGSAQKFGWHSVGAVANFGEVLGHMGQSHDLVWANKIERFISGAVINCGEVGKELGYGLSTILISANRSRGKVYRHAAFFLGERGLRRNRRLSGYLEGLGERLDRGRPYQDILRELETIDLEHDIREAWGWRRALSYNPMHTARGAARMCFRGVDRVAHFFSGPFMDPELDRAARVKPIVKRRKE